MPAVKVKGDTPTSQSWELERLRGKRVTKTGLVSYLVRWKGYGPEYDKWLRTSLLDNAKELIEDYE